VNKRSLKEGATRATDLKLISKDLAKEKQALYVT
jgi:hypothetical protein